MTGEAPYTPYTYLNPYGGSVTGRQNVAVCSVLLVHLKRKREIEKKEREIKGREIERERLKMREK